MLKPTLETQNYCDTETDARSKPFILIYRFLVKGFILVQVACVVSMVNPCLAENANREIAHHLHETIIADIWRHRARSPDLKALC